MAGLWERRTSTWTLCREMGMRAHHSPVPSVELPGSSGAYILEFHLDDRVVFRAGHLGEVELGPGIIRYYGSARGPGGIRARVTRHLRQQHRKNYWHVDALTSRIQVERVLVAPGGCECRLVQRDLDSGRWIVAARGFGSSDCRTCQSHLLTAERGSA